MKNYIVFASFSYCYEVWLMKANNEEDAIQKVKALNSNMTTFHVEEIEEYFRKEAENAILLASE